MSVSKPTPRFLPTLTEVVQPPELQMGHALDRAETIRLVLQKMMPVIEKELRIAMSDIIEQQLLSLIPAMQENIELAVSQAIIAAIDAGGTQSQ